MLVVGCDTSECEGRTDYPTLLALGNVELSGTPTIGGPQARIAANGSITVSGTADIEADLLVGGELIIEGNPRIVGDVETYTHDLQVADYTDVDKVRLDNDNDRIPCIRLLGGSCLRSLVGANLVLGATESLTLKSGSYFFSNIKMSGNAALKTVGNVWIYTDGPATFNGATASDQHWDTLTLVSNAADTITINGAAESAMHVQAPHATVKLAGTSEFLGSVIAQDIVLSGETSMYLTPGSLAKNCAPVDGDYD